MARSRKTRSRGGFAGLVEIMARLRSPGGCPWDRAQDPESLRPYIIEEAHEVLEALDTGDPEAIKEELGDLLLQVVFLSRLFQERGMFTVEDVIRGISDKLIYRHPHVFGDVTADTPDDVLKIWATAKSAGKKSVLEGVPRTLPALLKAQRTSEKAARVGFDWPRYSAIEKKLREELREFSQARTAAEREEEFGDILLTLANMARHLNMNAEIALQKATGRFIARFRRMEKTLGPRLRSASLEEWDKHWTAAKKHHRGRAAGRRR